jgi:glycosyltransferase involved in cell wall biosynthesis
MRSDPIRVLHLLPSWQHVGALRRIGMLARHLPAERFVFQVVALSARGPAPADFLPRGISLTAVAQADRLPIALAWKLRRLVSRWRPQVVHAWSDETARIARVALVGLAGVHVVTQNADLPLAVDIQLLHSQARGAPPRKDLCEMLGLPLDARLLCTAGRLTREANLIDALWAVDQIRCVRDDVYLLVIGGGEALPLIERYARLYEVDQRVRFLGWRSDAAALLACADVFCTASRRPRCSLSVLEAMALGLPVVASDTAAHRRLVVPNQTGILVDLRQRSEMSRWCLRLLEDADLRARFGEAARQVVAQQFPLEPFVQTYGRLYEQPGSSRQLRLGR